MCGIAGYLGRPVADGDALLRTMGDAMVHRGPDDEGFLRARNRDGSREVGLAHRRLSIIDLATGHQPIGNEDGTVQLVFNGEIYNFESLRRQLIDRGHAFTTASDSETIVHAYEEWGDACVERFRGMFAFALWDRRGERLLLARDPFGKKPLFLLEQDGMIYFASEIKAIVDLPGVRAGADLDSVSAYLAYRYVPGPATLFEGVRKLMPASIAVWQSGVLTETRYWTPPVGRAAAPVTLPADVPGAFRDLLEESVRLRMVSDVPFGAFLSGGLDSSAIVALMARHSQMPIRTFSVGFSESAYSEMDYARVVAQRFGTDHQELVISQDNLMEHLPALVRHRGAPVTEPSDIPIYLLSREARRSVKMILTGEGSDEILGGYPKHLVERLGGVYRASTPQVLRQKLFEPLVGSLPIHFRRAKTAVTTMGLADDEQRMIRWFGAITPAEITTLLAKVHDPLVGTSRLPFSADPAMSPLRRTLFFDQTSWLPDNLLERGDRMTMAASIEARMPFMDVELAAFTANLPDSWLVHGRTGKYLLRRAMADLLPEVSLNRKKVGFRVPVDLWFRGSMRDYLYDHLVGEYSRTRELYQPQELDRILREHVEARQNHEKLLWAMLGLEIWFREYE